MAKSNGKSKGRGPSTHPGPGGNWPARAGRGPSGENRGNAKGK